MIELKSDRLDLSFSDLFEQASFSIEFQRTLRIPDDDRTYPLPPGLGRFPLRHVDDYRKTVSKDWIEHGGVMFPMFQSEAMWLNFRTTHIADRGTAYPFAIKIAAGKINAVSGEGWRAGLNLRPQDYVVVPGQPWLDGFCVGQGVIRQFVAMPLGDGYTAEEQITGKAEHGGLQIIAYPMKRDVFERRFPKLERRRAMAGTVSGMAVPCAAPGAAMGLAPGGQMRQSIYTDPFGPDDWDLTQSSRVFVHICNSMVWRSITGQNPPHPPPTAKEYSAAGLPWFDYYDDTRTPVGGNGILSRLKSVVGLGKEKGVSAVPENETASDLTVVPLKQAGDVVREGAF